ncbi:MAG: flagellar biosynthesis protein FliQ [Alphaproteobacteria bacterium]
MDEAEIIDFARQAIILTMKLSAPVMMIGLAVGVVIALIQALTQIQEMTLAFVPKIMAIFLAIFLMFPMFAQALISFTQQIADKIISMG